MTTPRTNASHDQNYVTTLMGVSTTDGTTPVPVEVDPTTGALQVAGGTGGTGGSDTQYTDGGAAVTHPIGTIPVFNKAGTITAVSDTNPLPTSATVSTTGLALDATLTGGTQQAKVTDGTNTANVLKSDGTAAGQNSQLIAGTYLSTAFTTTTVQAVAVQDAGNYRWVSVQVTSSGTGSLITFQTSNDNVNWSSNFLMVNSASATTSVNNASTTGLWHGAIMGRYFRLNVTGISSGTTAGQVVFSTQPGAFNAIGAGVSSSNATGSAVPATAFYIGLNDGTNMVGAKDAIAAADANSGLGIASVHPSVYNGSTYDKARTATAASGTTGTGLFGVGALGFDGTNYQRIKTDTTGLLSVNNAPSTAGGLSIVTGSVGGTATVIKASAGQLYGYHLFNTTAAVAYVQIFNVAAASVTLGTTAPTISIGIPASGGASVNFDKGIAFGTAISYACTTTRAGATGATCDVNFFYS